MQVLCKSEWFAGLAFGASSPFAGFAGGFCFVALGAEDLKVLIAVVVGAAFVVDVVNLQTFGTTALNTLVPITRQDAFTCGGGDVRAVVVLPHVASILGVLLRSWSGGLAPVACGGVAVRLGAPDG